jgi:hypothetical protein
MSLRSFPVLSTIQADRRYIEGDTIDLDDATAAELTACGAIGLALGPAVTANPRVRADELVAQIKTATSEAEVNELLGADTRVTVLNAANARKTELSAIAAIASTETDPATLAPEV